MQTVIVFIVYFLLFNWLIISIGFIKKTGLNKWLLWGLFSIKIFAGLMYALFYLQPGYFEGSDTWRYFEISKTETDWLLKDPLAFVKDIFTDGYQQSGNLFLGENSYWNDLKSNIVIKLMALCNVLTFKNYWANIIFFNFLFFFGPVALYKLINQLYKVNKLLLLTCLFLIPSFLFWCSGVHKDGLIFTCTALIIFHFNTQLQQKKIIWLPFIISILCFGLLFALRNFMALLLVPALLVWLLCYLYPQRAKLSAVLIYTTGIVLFFLSGKISTQTDLPQYVIEKQSEFKQLSGTSQIPVPLLENNVLSFIKFLPAAVDIAFLRPHVTELKNKSYIPAAAEVLLLWIIAAATLFMRRKNNSSPQQEAWLIFCLCFSVSFLMLAGYTIPFSGAIVRYRAVVLPFLFLPVLLMLNLEKIPLLKKFRI